jgi:hypothetical protein
MFPFTSKDIPAYLSLLIGSTIIATIVSWWAVKKYGLLPKRPDENDAPKTIKGKTKHDAKIP